MVDLSDDSDAWWNATIWKLSPFTPDYVSIECEIYVHDEKNGDCEYHEVVGVVPKQYAIDIVFAHNQVLQRLKNNISTLHNALHDLTRSLDAKASEVVYSCPDDAYDLTEYLRAAKDALRVTTDIDQN